MYRADLLLTDTSAERAVLGAIALNNEALTVALAAGLGADDFSHAGHAAVFRAACDLVDGGAVADPVTLRDALDRAGKLHLCPIVDLAAMLDAVPAVSSVGHYVGIVLAKSRARRLLIGLETGAAGIRANEPIDSVRDAVVSAIESTLPQAQGDEGKLVDFLRRDVGLKPSRSTPWAWPALQHATAGIPDSALTILGAYPGTGKTALATAQAAWLAQHETPIAFFSCEMGAAQLIATLMARDAGVSVQRLRYEGVAGFRGEESSRLSRSCGRLGAWPFYLSARSASATEIVARSRLWARQYGVRVVFVDYLQLLKRQGNEESRRLGIDSAVQALKALAGTTGIAIVVLSQLRRTEKRSEASVGDLKESQGIEEAADLVLLLRRPKLGQNHVCTPCGGVYGRNPSCPACGGVGTVSDDDELLVTVGKNRFGASGGIARLRWHGPTMRISKWEDGNDG